MNQIITVRVEDAEALRAGLDAKNENGIEPVTVGIDALERPFLICLVGAYADGEHVFFYSPWESEADYGGVEHCDECMGKHNSLADLEFPVLVMDQLDQR